MKEIFLTQNQKTLVDDIDYDYLNKWKWFAHKNKNKSIFYARRGKTINKKFCIILMHRQILNVTDSKILVDHRDRNGLNNQRSNLRLCDTSQNCANRISSKNSTSKYLGVYFDKHSNKWKAGVRKRTNIINLGYFNSEKEAAMAYNSKAKKIHGKFANLNKIL